MNKVWIESGGYRITGNLSQVESKSKIWSLCLHGGGTATKEKYLRWQKHLSTKGIHSLAIDFLGIGESEGIFHESSLSNRIQNAKDAIEYIHTITFESPTIIINGSSMGGYIAACVCNYEPDIAGIILTSAAAYTPSANDKKFGPEFTQTLKTTTNFSNSIAFRELERYKGRILVAYGNHDSVIPEEVKQKYKREALRRLGNYVEIQSCGHKMLMENSSNGLRVYQDLMTHADDFLAHVLADLK